MSKPKQRSRWRRSRRTFLRGVGVAGLVSVAGCVGGGGDGGSSGNGTTQGGGGGGDTTSTATETQATTAGTTETPAETTTQAGDDTATATQGGGGQSMSIYIMSAGSLNNALLSDFKNAVDVPVKIESHGSAEVARLVAEGVKDPDIVALADTALFDKPLNPPWYSVFTSNAVVIATNKNTKWRNRVAKAGTDGWYKSMLDGNVTLGRTPPDQDPLGYRTLFMLDLASRYYDDASNLRKKIPKKKQISSETSLLSGFETGALDAAIVYRNMAVERDYPYIDLPNEIDLSDPKYVKDWYSTTSYTLPNGKEIQGDLISYGATIRKMSTGALTAFDVLTTGNYLSEHGFLLRKQFPNYKGDVPKQVKQGVSTGGGDPQASGNQSTAGNQSSMRPVSLSPDVSDITLLV